MRCNWGHWAVALLFPGPSTKASSRKTGARSWLVKSVQDRVCACTGEGKHLTTQPWEQLSKHRAVSAAWKATHLIKTPCAIAVAGQKSLILVWLHSGNSPYKRVCSHKLCSWDSPPVPPQTYQNTPDESSKRSSCRASGLRSPPPLLSSASHGAALSTSSKKIFQLKQGLANKLT